MERSSEKALASGVRSRNTFPSSGGPRLLGDAPRSIQKYYAPVLGAFSIAPERRKMKLKKKTLYNILMIAAIAVIAALAVFFAGRHLGWFDKPAPEGVTAASPA